MVLQQRQFRLVYWRSGRVPNVRYSSAVCACCRVQEAAGESRIGLGGFTRSPHEVRDRRGSLRRLPEPWRVAGGQHLQSRVRDKLGHCLDDRNAAERVLLAPYHHVGIASWRSSSGRTLE
jgi:hypothetical protein